MKLGPRNYYLDDLFDNFLIGEDSKMKCDIFEKEGKYYIEMDVPGYNKEDIKIECNKGNIIITAEKEENKEEKEEKKYIRHERVYGKYQRSFYLGEIEEDSIEAKFENGTLIVSASKKDENESKKYIEVK